VLSEVYYVMLCIMYVMLHFEKIACVVVAGLQVVAQKYLVNSTSTSVARTTALNTQVRSEEARTKIS